MTQQVRYGLKLFHSSGYVQTLKFLELEEFVAVDEDETWNVDPPVLCCSLPWLTANIIVILKAQVSSKVIRLLSSSPVIWSLITESCANVTEIFTLLHPSQPCSNWMFWTWTIFQGCDLLDVDGGGNSSSAEALRFCLFYSIFFLFLFGM